MFPSCSTHAQEEPRRHKACLQRLACCRKLGPRNADVAAFRAQVQLIEGGSTLDHLKPNPSWLMELVNQRV